MTRAFTQLTFTDAVKAAQTRYGTRASGAALEGRSPPNDALSEPVMQFIRERDSFFIATASREGWPHVQHRGGPKGFLRVLDERTLAFGDFDGNRQYITIGNLGENDRVCLFVPDYAAGRRLKVWGRAAVLDEPDLVASVADPSYPAAPQRVVRIGVLAWDFNCRQHIKRRFDEDEVMAMIAQRDEQLGRVGAGDAISS